jgi:hypothetical protein
MNHLSPRLIPDLFHHLSFQQDLHHHPCHDFQVHLKFVRHLHHFIHLDFQLHHFIHLDFQLHHQNLKPNLLQIPYFKLHQLHSDFIHHQSIHQLHSLLQIHDLHFN